MPSPHIYPDQTSGRSKGVDSGISEQKSKDFDVKNVHDKIRMTVQEHHVTADQDVSAFGRGRRQATFEFDGAGLNTLLQTGRKRSPTD
jgi:hypothetical protein